MVVIPVFFLCCLLQGCLAAEPRDEEAVHVAMQKQMRACLEGNAEEMEACAVKAEDDYFILMVIDNALQQDAEEMMSAQPGTQADMEQALAQLQAIIPEHKGSNLGLVQQNWDLIKGLMEVCAVHPLHHCETAHTIVQAIADENDVLFEIV